MTDTDKASRAKDAKRRKTVKGLDVLAPQEKRNSSFREEDPATRSRLGAFTRDQWHI